MGTFGPISKCDDVATSGAKMAIAFSASLATDLARRFSPAAAIESIGLLDPRELSTGGGELLGRDWGREEDLKTRCCDLVTQTPGFVAGGSKNSLESLQALL